MIIKMSSGENGFANHSNDCNCERGNAAIVFIEPQKIGTIYSLHDAFESGTLYPELNKPFLGGGYYNER